MLTTSPFRKVIANVPAAGSGQRMGLNHSKLLCEVAGEAVLLRTIKTLASAFEFEQIIIPCRESEREIFARLLAPTSSSISFVAGGATRQHSVNNALAAIKTSYAKTQDILVLLHDAARCLVTESLIRRSIQSATECFAMTSAVACTDTVHMVDNNDVLKLPLLDRSTLRSIQTPQVFSFDLLWKAHADPNLLGSDDAGLVANFHAVKVIEGEMSNVKITTVNDLVFAEAYLAGLKSAR